MGISKERVEEILNQSGIKYQDHERASSDNPIIVTGWGMDDPEVGRISLKVVILLDEKASDGTFELVHVRAIRLGDGLKKPLHELEPSKLLALYRFMARENYSNKLGTWCFDENDGDIYVSAVVPIENGDMTAEQLMRLVAVITQVGKEGYRDIRRIVAHGDPKKPLSVGIPANMLVDLTVALVKAGKIDLVERLKDYRGDADALKAAVENGNWEEATRLLEPVPTSI